VRRRKIERLQAAASKSVVIRVAIAVDPVNIFDRVLEGAVDPLEKLDLIEPNHCQHMPDAGNSGLTNADSRHIRRFHECDIGNPQRRCI
jgi:hypothetical protein